MWPSDPALSINQCHFCAHPRKNWFLCGASQRADGDVLLWLPHQAVAGIDVSRFNCDKSAMIARLGFFLLLLGFAWTQELVATREPCGATPFTFSSNSTLSGNDTSAVATNGDTIAIGRRGTVEIWVRDSAGSNSWTHTQTLSDPSGATSISST